MKTKDDPKEVKKEIKKQGHANQNIYDFNPSQFEVINILVCVALFDFAFF